VVCYFGFLNATKGALDLVQAMSRLVRRGEDTRLLFIGGLAGASDPANTAYAAQVRAEIDRLGLGERVLYTGFVKEADVSAAFYASDICVLPYRDGASYRRGSLMAALAHGMPIITTEPSMQVSGLSEGANVMLVPPGDVEALAEAIASLCGNPKERQRLAKAAQGLAQRFAWDSIAADAVAVYRDAIAAFSGPSRLGRV